MEIGFFGSVKFWEGVSLVFLRVGLRYSDGDFIWMSFRVCGMRVRFVSVVIDFFFSWVGGCD